MGGIRRANREIITVGGPGEEPRLFDPDGPLIPVEINLEELPLFLFQARGRTAQRVLETRDTVLLESGERLEKYFKVTGSEEFGLPGPSDRDVYLAVIRLMQRTGGMPADGRVGFSLYEILGILGHSDGSKNYKNIRRSIDRIGATLVYAENGFYNREGEIFETHRFQPWRPFFRQAKAKGRRSERHVVRFDELLVKSYHSNYLKTLDADFHFSLDNDLAKLLYGLIDVRRAGTLAYSEEIHRLRRLIPLPDSYYQPSRIKKRLDPAYRELLRRGFLTRVDYEAAGSSEVVRHRISPVFVQQRDVFSAGLTHIERETLERMLSVGVWPSRAREVLAAHGADQCEVFLEALPRQKRLRNQAAWLVRAIENDWRDALGNPGSPEGLPAPRPVEADPPPTLGLDLYPAAAAGGGVPEGSPEGSPEGIPEGVPEGIPRATREARELFAEVLDELNLSGEKGSSGSSTRVSLDVDLATRLEAGCLTLTVPARAVRDYTEKHLRPLVEASLRRRLGEHAILRIVGAPKTEPAAEDLRREFEARRDAGEFERAIETFEALPYQEYRQWVGQEPIHPDGNRYYLSLDGDLSACIGGRGPEHRFFLCSLDRPDQ